jgi:hypothetical protein
MPFDLTAENAKNTKMKTLHPIIRRKRRSLIIADMPPMTAQTMPVQLMVKTPAVEPVKKLKAADAKNLSSLATP